MAGSVTITISKVSTPYSEDRGIVLAEIDWVGASSGGAVTAVDFSAANVLAVLGRKCVLAVTDPGSVAPTASYDIEIKDEYGVDVFGGELKDRHTINSEQTQPKIGADYGPRLCAGTWTFNLSGNSVNSATGKCVLYFEV